MTRFERSLIIGFGVSLVWCQLLAPWLLSTSKVSSNQKFYQGLAEMLGERYIPFTGNSGMNFLVCVVFATLALCFWDFGLKENSALDAGIRLTACVAGAAGVGTLGIVDHDVVERSNLNRQVIHSDADTVDQLEADDAAKGIDAVEAALRAWDAR